MKTGERVEWAALRQASGTCEHIPDALMGLCSGDATTRDAAYWKIDNHVIRQGDLYEAAPYVVRELVSLLSQCTTGRDRVYDLLIEFANGDSPADTRIVWAGKDVSLKAATTQGLVDGLVAYQNDLRSHRPIIRKRASELLLSLSDHVALSSMEIHALAHIESDPEVKLLLVELERNLGPRSSR